MTTTARVFQNYIGGKWQDSQSGKNFANYNPATGEIVGYFPLSGAAEADAAVSAARAAFEKWRLVPAPKRGEILFKFESGWKLYYAMTADHDHAKP